MGKRYVGVIVLVVITTWYVLLRAQIFLTGPMLTVYSPTPHSTEPQTVTVEGHTEGAVFLSVNDQRVFPNRDGFFKKEIILPIGYTIVKVYAQSRQKKETAIYLPLYINSTPDKGTITTTQNKI